MTYRFESSEVIDRSIDKVFHFYAVEHVRNHPRWDPDMDLWLESDAPIGVGTIIHRRNRHGGTPVEGTMEVVEFEPNRLMAVVIHDGAAETRARITFDAVSDSQTRLTTALEIPAMDATADMSRFERLLERSSRNRKALMESEIQML